MLEKITGDDFRPYLNTTFRIVTDSDAEKLEVELIEVSDIGDAPGDGRRQPFSLIFRGPKGVYLPQKIYPVEHEAMETLEIFLVPISPDTQGMRVQAIFY